MKKYGINTPIYSVMPSVYNRDSNVLFKATDRGSFGAACRTPVGTILGYYIVMDDLHVTRLLDSTHVSIGLFVINVI